MRYLRPATTSRNRPNAIVCKFVRRLAKDQVMAARKKVGGLKAEELGLQLISVSSILITMIT